jgi:hypothetical protein
LPRDRSALASPYLKILRVEIIFGQETGEKLESEGPTRQVWIVRAAEFLEEPPRSRSKHGAQASWKYGVHGEVTATEDNTHRR